MRSSHHESLHHRLLKLGFYCQPVQVSEIRHWRTEMLGFYILSQSQKIHWGTEMSGFYILSQTQKIHWRLEMSGFYIPSQSQKL